MNRTATFRTTLGLMFTLACPALAEIPEQTPIDIRRDAVVPDPATPTIEFHYGTVDVKLTNTFGAVDETTPGRLIAEEWATLKATPQNATPHILVNGKRYDLLQFHFHTPSEHAVGGKRTVMEVHFVHIDHDEGCNAAERPLVVLGALIQKSDDEEPAHELDRLFPAGLPDTKDDPAVDVAGVNLDALLPNRKKSWRYEGSLTAPSNACGSFEPLSTQLVTGEFPEAVHWYVYEQRMHASPESARRLRELFPEGNSRNLKLVGDREVFGTPKPPKPPKH